MWNRGKRSRSNRSTLTPCCASSVEHVEPAGPPPMTTISGIFALALGPHPQRDLTLTPRGGFACPPRGVAAGAFALALGPHPQRDLTLTPRRGFPWPRRRVAAGASEEP